MLSALYSHITKEKCHRKQATSMWWTKDDIDCEMSQHFMYEMFFYADNFNKKSQSFTAKGIELILLKF
jgi:hypothetical protein